MMLAFILSSPPPAPDPPKMGPEPVMPFWQFLVRVGLAILALAVVFTAVGVAGGLRGWGLEERQIPLTRSDSTL